MPDQRPNILYIFTDQQAGSAMSCAGNPELRTPAIDRLAAEGAMFSNTYCTFPLCTPSRASMFTGLMPHECGADRNGRPIREDLRDRGLGRVLQAQKYECVYGGKWHVPGIAMPEDNDHGFRPISGFNDTLLAGACLEFLAEHARQAPAARRPFFCVASFDNPHNICEWGRNMALPWGPIGEPPPLEQCPNLPANFSPAPFEAEIARVEQRANWAIYPYRERSAEDWRRLRWAYFRLVERVDAEIGKLLAGLDEHGLAEKTVVIFSSDHGDGHGAHQWNQKSALFEEMTRVPMIVRAPGGKAGLKDETHLVSNGLDLYPTVCDYAGVEPPPGLNGQSLRPLVEGGPEASWRDTLFIETAFDGDRAYGAEGRVVRQGQYKYTVYDRGAYREQLHDLGRDPGETVNLAVEARHRELLSHLRRLLANHCRETGDRFRCTH